MADIDLDMRAAPIARVLSRYGCPIDATAGGIRPALPALTAQVRANAATAGKYLGTAVDGEDLAAPHQRVTNLTTDAAALGQPEWLKRWMACDAAR